MTFKLGKMTVIAGEKSARCEECGKQEELRPYGKNAANVCFNCAMKDETNARAMFIKRINGDS